jgi:hypothetical protein
MKRLLYSAAFAVALMIPATAGAQISVRIGPPRPPREVIVARPGPNYVWTPGYYRWSGNRYVWAPGAWVVPPHRHARWVPGYWARRHGGYVWVDGRWR